MSLFQVAIIAARIIRPPKKPKVRTSNPSRPAGADAARSGEGFGCGR
jgi:hypothetical protein